MTATTTLAEAQARYKATAASLSAAIRQMEAMTELYDSANDDGRDDEADIFFARLQTLYAEIEAAGTDHHWAGEILDSFESDPGDPNWSDR